MTVEKSLRSTGRRSPGKAPQFAPGQNYYGPLARHVPTDITWKNLPQSLTPIGFPFDRRPFRLRRFFTE
jgi:hypothetical protein